MGHTSPCWTALQGIRGELTTTSWLKLVHAQGGKPQMPITAVVEPSAG